MTIIPGTTPVPKPGTVFMAPTSPAPIPTQPPTTTAPTPSPIPITLHDQTTHPSAPKPPPLPTLRLEIRALTHPGATKFLTSTTASTLLSTAITNIHTHLYPSPSPFVPPTRSVTLILRDMGGVAYTTGTDLDPTHHKEIHLSLSYIASIAPSRLTDEITGVLTHELVHCYQHNGSGSCPGGLIEGVADWVRLCCGLSPPHWKREVTGRWDAGYQTTAYFLAWLEEEFGRGTVRKLNERLKGRRYEEREFWVGLVGKEVGVLWGEYVEHVAKGEGRGVDGVTQT